MSFGLNVTNMFELLGEEGEESNQKGGAKKQVAQKTAVAPSKANEPSKNDRLGSKPAETKPKAPSDPVGGALEDAGKPARRGGRGGGGGSGGVVSGAGNGGGRGGHPADQRGDNNNNDKPRERRDKHAEFDRRNKRVFDRSKSGTGRGREIKKGGAGKGNWGKEGEEGAKEEAAVPKEEEEGKEDAATSGAAAATAPADAPPKELTEEEKKYQAELEQEAKMKTYEEYLKEQEERKAKVALPKPRRPNEGSDSKWNSYEVLKRDETEQEEDAPQKKENKPKQSAVSKVSVDEVLNVSQPPRPTGGGRGRGRRGGGSDRGGRGGGRGAIAPRKQQQAPPSLDANNFPGLNNQQK